MSLAPKVSAQYGFAMAATLRTIQASVAADGTVSLAEKITGPAKAVLTLLVEEPEANEETAAAIAEPVAGLKRFETLADLKSDLES
jgi:hypothetical protein